jgi:hypothetical protein
VAILALDSEKEDVVGAHELNPADKDWMFQDTDVGDELLELAFQLGAAFFDELSIEVDTSERAFPRGIRDVAERRAELFEQLLERAEPPEQRVPRSRFAGTVFQLK